MINNIDYLKYLKINDLIKIIKYIDYKKHRDLLIERFYKENLINTNDLIFFNYIKNDLKLKLFKNIIN